MQSEIDFLKNLLQTTNSLNESHKEDVTLYFNRCTYILKQYIQLNLALVQFARTNKEFHHEDMKLLKENLEYWMKTINGFTFDDFDKLLPTLMKSQLFFQQCFRHVIELKKINPDDLVDDSFVEATPSAVPQGVASVTIN
jgi:hypothetical protein